MDTNLIKLTTLSKVLQELEAGNIVILEEYEKTYKRNVMVRLKDGITYTSYDAETSDVSWSGRYWSLEHIPLNAFTLYTVYKIGVDTDVNK